MNQDSKSEVSKNIDIPQEEKIVSDQNEQKDVP